MTEIYNNLCPNCGKPMNFFENKEENNPKYSCPYCHTYVHKYSAKLIELQGTKPINAEVPAIIDHCLDQIASKSFGMSKEEVVCTILKDYIQKNGTKGVKK